MQALREVVKSATKDYHLRLPDWAVGHEVEVIVLPRERVDTPPLSTRKRRPAASLAGTRIVGDIVSSVVPDSDWEILNETSS